MAKKKIVIVKDILEKMGKEFSTKISETRAQSKLERAIENDGLDDITLNDVEIKYLESLGYEIEDEDEAELFDDLDDSDLDKVKADDFEEPWEDNEKEDEEDIVIPAPKKKKKAPEVKEEEDEEEEVKPKKKKPTEKKAPKKTVKKMSKNSAICIILKKRKNHTLEKLAKEVDDLYVKNGGPSNVVGTMRMCIDACNVLREYTILTFNDGIIKIK